MAKQIGRARGAFTLVELLVVLAIIAVLLAILLPVLHRARRAAEVLASPIAYMGKDGTVHLTDPSGGTDVGIAARSRVSCPVCHSPPVWSPSGQILAFGYSEGGSQADPGITVFADPVSNRIRRYADGQFFLSWSDSDNVIEGNRGGPLEVWSASNHSLRTQIMPPVQVFSISPAPSASQEPYVGIFSPQLRPSESLVVGFLRRDLSPGKVIWTSDHDRRRSVEEMQRPRIDPLGEYVAWTMLRGGGMSIAIKNVRDPTSIDPTFIRAPFQSVYFCDWAENETLLANVSDDYQHWHLAIFDRKGRLIRKLATPAEPAMGVVASWRKYGHR